MTRIISEDIIKKVYDLMSSNTRIEFGRKKLLLFVRLYYNDFLLGEDFIESYDTLEGLELAAYSLEDLFINSKYVGEFKK